MRPSATMTHWCNSPSRAPPGPRLVASATNAPRGATRAPASAVTMEVTGRRAAVGAWPSTPPGSCQSAAIRPSPAAAAVARNVSGFVKKLRPTTRPRTKAHLLRPVFA